MSIGDIIPLLSLSTLSHTLSLTVTSRFTEIPEQRFAEAENTVYIESVVADEYVVAYVLLKTKFEFRLKFFNLV